MPVCASCGHGVPPDAAFCGTCGADVRGVPAVCPACGEQADVAARYCPACGSPVVPGPIGAPPGSFGDGRASSRRRRLAPVMLVLVLAVLAAAAVAAVLLLRDGDGSPDAGPASSSVVQDDVSGSALIQPESVEEYELAGSWHGSLVVEEEWYPGERWQPSQVSPATVDLTIYEVAPSDNLRGEIAIEPVGEDTFYGTIVQLEPDGPSVRLTVKYLLPSSGYPVRASIVGFVDGPRISGAYEDEDPVEGWVSWRGTIELVKVDSE